MPPIAWDSCPATISRTASDGATFDLRCAHVLVPVSHDHPRGQLLSLDVVEAREPGLDVNAPILFLMRGDPGEFGPEAIADAAASLSSDVRARYAIVTMATRGTGGSNAIDCVTPGTAAAMLGMSAHPSNEVGSAQLRSIARQLTFDCGDTVGTALTRFNSTAAADDIDAVRSSLGVPTLTVMGSGGTATIATAYVDRYPGRVAAAVLDSPGDAAATPEQHASNAAAAAERLFDDFAAACQGFDGGCPLGSDPRGMVSQLVARFDTSGVRAGDLVVTAGSLLATLVEQLPNRPAWPAVASAIARFDEGDAEGVATLLTDAWGDNDMSALLSARVLFACNDSSERLSSERIAAAAEGAATAAPLFGSYLLAPQGWCMSWPAPDEPLSRPSGVGAPPVLVIGSVVNPLHPFVEAQAVTSQLSSATLLSWQSGVDDGYAASPCIQRTVDAYLLTGAVPDRGLLCPP